MEKVLPKGWLKLNFTDLLDIKGGNQPPKSQFINEPQEGYVRLLQIRDFGNKPVPTYVPIKQNQLECNEDDVLIARYGASIGRIVTGMKGTYNVALAKVISPEILPKNFIKWYLKSDIFQRSITSTQRTAQNGFNKEDLESVIFPLPPLAEQERIVVKLDKLFTQHEKIKAALDRIPQLLKNFRQQVLTQAVTGKLTEQWREGKELTEWKEVDLQEVSKIVDPHPSHRTPPEVENGIPYISIGDINLDKSINFKKSRKVSEKILEEHIARYTIKKGDFIFGKIGTIGKPIKIPAKQNYCLSANVILIQPNENLVISEYVYIYLDSPYLLKKVLEKSVATSQAAYGIKKMRVEKINLPSRIEQQEIVSRVESLFAKADAIEARYTNLKKKIDSLPQAILHKAFKGELVPQLPTDGDAKDLLAAIIKLKEEAKGKRGKR